MSSTPRAPQEHSQNKIIKGKKKRVNGRKVRRTIGRNRRKEYQEGTKGRTDKRTGGWKERMKEGIKV